MEKKWPATLSTMMDIFSWKNQQAYHNDIVDAYHNLLEEKFNKRIEAFVKAGVGKSLESSIAALSKRSLKRIIVAPRTSNDLLFNENVNLVYYKDAVLAEHCLSNQEEASKNVWTACDDFYFNCKKEIKEFSILEYLGREKSAMDRPYSAPILDQTIVLDFESPHAVERIKDDTQEFHPLSDSEQQTMQRKLQKAMNVLSEVSPEAYQFVKAYTQVIVIGKDIKNPKEFSSSSTEFNIGRVVLTNYHTKYVSIDEIVDTLIHEAIHIAIYIIELEHPIISRSIQDQVDRAQARSSWTGNKLYLHAFFHACFVWLGLWCFWLKLKEDKCTVFSKKIINQRIEAAKFGFKNGELPSSLSEVDQHLTEEAKEVIWSFVKNADHDILPLSTVA